jgi:hypothetical protein
VAIKNSATHAVDILLSDFLCLIPGERTVITADMTSDMRLVQALLDGAYRRGRQASAVIVPRLPSQGAGADVGITDACRAAIMNTDLWIDMTFPYMAGSGPHDEVMHAGKARYLLLGDANLESFTRLFGDIELDQYFEAQAEFDKTFGRKGARCRITCPKGSDFSFELAKPIFEKPRRATKPGMYTIPGACSIGADSKTIKGRIVLGAVFHQSYEVLPQPVVVEVDGAIQSIKGAGAAAIKFGQAVRRATGSGSGMIIHLTNGLHPTANFTGKCFNEDMRALGNNAVGFGLPWWEPGGGENHPDGIILGQSVWIDNELVIDSGRIVGGSEGLVRKADALVA